MFERVVDLFFIVHLEHIHNIDFIKNKFQLKNHIYKYRLKVFSMKKNIFIDFGFVKTNSFSRDLAFNFKAGGIKMISVERIYTNFSNFMN